MKTLAVFSLLVVTSAFAQVENLGTVEVIDVQGNKEDKNYLESNESISILKPKNLNRGDSENSIQMLNGLSNVQTTPNGGSFSFSIRGISDMGVTGYQKDNLASVVVDDVFQTPIALKAGSFENWDLASIEVYRGAQSTTQGVNSLAGSILLYHVKPQEGDEGAAKAVLGNFGRKDGGVVLNKTLLDKKLSTRFSYNKETSDGFIKNQANGNDKWGARNKDHFVSDFIYRLNDKDELRLNVKILRLRQGGSYIQSDDLDYEVDEDVDYKSITNNQQTSLTYNKFFNESWSNKLTLAYSRGQDNITSDADGLAANDAGIRYGYDRDSYMSLENLLKYKSDKVKNVFGLHLHRYNLKNFYDFSVLIRSPMFATMAVTQENEKDRKVYSLFDSFIYNFTEHHSINLGARLEIVENKYGANLTGDPSSILYSSFQDFFKQYDDTAKNAIVLPKIGYTYKNGHYSLGAMYTQGYRTGGLSINRARSEVNEYAPERTHNYELSYKYVKSSLQIASNIFYTRWNDQQVEVELTGDMYDTRVENISSSELYGAEFETNYEHSNGDSVRLNLGYVKTRFLNFKNDGTNYNGKEFPDAAKTTAQLAFWKSLHDDWRLIPTLRYVGKSYSNAENTRKSPEQYYVDFNTQYTFGNYVAELYVKNVFDQKYQVYDGTSTQASYPASYHRMSTPREFGGRLNYYW